MKRKIMIVVLCIFAASFLTACATTETEEQPTSAITATADSGDTPLSTQLLLGSFELEDSELAISADQASELLPLWKAVKTLSESDTTSSVELDALYNQIQDLMTTDQLNQIVSMEITGESMQAMAEELGLDITMGADDSEGGAKMGPGGDMGVIGVEGMTDEQRAMMESMSDEELAAARAERMGGSNPMNTMILDPLIELLEERVA